jgi:hypothetical protein
VSEESKNESFFLATLMFTNGVCPYCKEKLGEPRGESNMMDPKKAIKHMHDKGHERDVERSRGIASGM